MNSEVWRLWVTDWRKCNLKSCKCAWYFWTWCNLLACFLYLHAQRMFSFWDLFGNKIILSLSIHKFWAFAGFSLSSWFVFTAWLLSINPSFLLQVIFLPAFHFLFLLFLPFLAMENSFSSTLMNYNIFLHSTECFNDDGFVESFNHGDDDLRDFLRWLFEAHCEVTLNFVDIGQQERRFDRHDMGLAQFLSVLQHNLPVELKGRRMEHVQQILQAEIAWRCVAKRKSRRVTYSIVFSCTVGCLLYT